MRFRREEEDNFAFDMTPMIDVVFLLLIFFMVSTVFVDFSRKMDINLPTSKSSVIDESTKTPGDRDVERQKNLSGRQAVNATGAGNDSRQNGFQGQKTKHYHSGR